MKILALINHIIETNADGERKTIKLIVVAKSIAVTPKEKVKSLVVLFKIDERETYSDLLLMKRSIETMFVMKSSVLFLFCPFLSSREKSFAHEWSNENNVFILVDHFSLYLVLLVKVRYILVNVVQVYESIKIIVD